MSYGFYDLMALSQGGVTGVDPEGGNIINAVYARLSTFAPLLEKVPENIFEENVPQEGTYPAVVFNRVSTRHIEDLQGKGGLACTWIQIDTLGHEKNALESIAKTVRRALTGSNFVGTFAGVVVHGGRTLPDVDGPVDFSANLRRVTQQFEIWHDEIEPD